MYNRYIRNDNGSYSRIPEEESHRPPPPPPRQEPPAKQEKPPTGTDGQNGMFRTLLDQFHFDHIDIGDLLLLGLLFFLYREQADEELLVALGLLLIL